MPAGHHRLIRAGLAITVSLTQADTAPGLRLAASLRPYWQARGHGAEGADALRALLDTPAAQAATLLRARALAAAGHLLQLTGGYAMAEDFCQEALTIAHAAARLARPWKEYRQGARRHARVRW
jgi:hypothetical protein